MSCFFEIESNNSSSEEIQLEFQGNDGNAGAALDGGALKHCKVEIYDVLANITG